MTEFESKQSTIKALLAEKHLDGLLLQRVSSFAWATCGASSYVNTATTNGAASLLITPAGRYALTTNIEATRIKQEEKLEAQGWEIRAAPWHGPNPALAELTRGLSLGSDGPYPDALDLSGELARLRAILLPEEVTRFRTLGALCAEAMDVAIRAVKPDMSEYEIAGRLARETESRGAQAIVNLMPAEGRKCSTVEAISTPEYPTPAKRPLYSALDCEKFYTVFGLRLPSWQETLKLAMEILS